MGNATIGSLRAVLGLDRAEFTQGLDAAQKQLRQAGKEFEKVGRQITGVGRSMTASITLPVIGLGAAVIKTAADFEAAMGRVGISTGAAGEQMRELSTLARQIGKDTVFSASEAADAMDMLAKAGVSTTDILNGAARATVNLAAAAGTDLDPAASAITDSMAQFKIAVADLPMVVNQITGAVNESKLDFSDFALAIGQAGGVAGALGVSFEDFNAALAATSPLFSSGSDAGTSFKTFLQTMVPTTTKAATAMQEYGLAFFDAAGNMKPMAEIAEMLRTNLSGLSDSAKTEVLKDIFGTDAMRTAIGLMQQGSDGLENIARRIAETDAAAQAAKRMEGFNGQLEQLGGAFEELAIAIGESGILKIATDIVKAIGDIMTKISEFSPVALQIGLVFAGIAAAIGPVLIVVGSLISAWGALATALGGGGVLVAIGGFAAAAAPFVAAGAAIGAVIYAFRDELGPIMKDFADAVIEAVGPALPGIMSAAQEAFAALGEAVGALVRLVAPLVEGLGRLLLNAFGPPIVLGLKVFVAALTTSLQMAADVLRFIASVLTGDWSGAWSAAKDLVMDAVRGVGRIIETVFPGALGWMQRLYEGVRDWLQNKLGGVFDWVGRKTREVGDAFFTLYDRVVGHSYIPDMVDEIGAEIARLDAVLVRPVERATRTAAQSFRDLQEQARTSMEDLMTDRERLALDLQRDLGAYERQRAGGAINQQRYDDMVRRRRNRFAEESAEIDARGITTGPNRGTPDFDFLEPFNETMTRMRESIEDSRERFADAFAYGIDAAMRGDWQGVLRSIVGDIFGNSLRKLGGQLFDRLGGGTGGGVNIGSVVSGLFKGLPRFKDGGTIRAGGSGGIDSQLTAFWKSPSEQVDIYDPSKSGSSGGSPLHFDMRGAVMTSDLLGQMEGMAARSGGNALRTARTAVPADRKKSDRYTLSGHR